MTEENKIGLSLKLEQGLSMNECEQIHPLLRGYLGETLSARERRLVARHLNLCASARKELDRLRGGSLKTPANPTDPPKEHWDTKILNWMVKTPKAAATPPPAPKPVEPPPKKTRPVREPSPAAAETVSSPSRLKPFLKIAFIFGALILLTHFIQNAGENSAVKGVKHLFSKNHILGVGPSLDLVLDLTNLSHWDSNVAPVAFSYHDLITDMDHFKTYWGFVEPGTPLPEVDFTKNALAIVFLGNKSAAGYTVKFKRMENYTDKTILWYDEVAPQSGEFAAAGNNRPWMLQLVPKPTQQPVLIQKIQ